MRRRINVMIDDEVWQVLAKAPRGERSRIINSALVQWFGRKRRNRASRKLDELRERMPEISTREIVSWLQEDRERME